MTNYLDLATQEELEIMLQEYPGTILFISHDRAFIRSVADHILQVDESEPRIFHGNYEQYTKRTTGDSVNVTEQEYETLLVQIRKCEEALECIPYISTGPSAFPKKYWNFDIE